MRISKSNKPQLCISMGYPAGIGPEVIAKTLASPKIRRLANFLIVGDDLVFKKALSAAKTKVPYCIIDSDAGIDFSKNQILLLSLANVHSEKFYFGKTDSSLGRASLDYVTKSVSLIQSSKADILVTAPIHKKAAELSGFKFPGHTEYLAHLTNTKNYAMMFAGGPLKIVLATIHIPLKDVSRHIFIERIANVLELSDTALRKNFGIKNPKIIVCGLNPHAGEGGLLGDEEQRIIAPAIGKAKAKNINAIGPIAADSVFYDLLKGKYDCALSMYHDQGLIALKMIARDESVNITLGLPFIRTSPAHGTALDIAGKGTASAESMKQAIRVAVSMFHNQPHA